jgi:hypothetical protein
MAIIDHSQSGSFGPSVARAMGDAFDAACRQLHEATQHFVAREVIANKIIEAAKRGERDPMRLCAAALAGFNAR